MPADKRDESSKLNSTAALVNTLFVVLCLITVVTSHALYENSASSLYNKWKNNMIDSTENTKILITAYEWTTRGEFKDDPWKIFSGSTGLLGVYPSIIMAFLPSYVLIKWLRKNLASKLKETNSDFGDAMEKMSLRILFVSISVSIVFWISFLLFILLNEDYSVYNFVDYALMLVFSFLITEIVYLTTFFHQKVELIKKMMPNSESDKIKAIIDLDGKSWTQILQIHMLLYATGLVGFYLTYYSKSIGDLPTTITSTPEFGMFITINAFWISVTLLGMLIVFSLIIAYLNRLSGFIMDVSD